MLVGFGAALMLCLYAPKSQGSGGNRLSLNRVEHRDASEDMLHKYSHSTIPEGDRIYGVVGVPFRFKVNTDRLKDPFLPKERPHLRLLTEDGKPLFQTSWIKLDWLHHEIYGFPLPGNEGVSTFYVKAVSSAGREKIELYKVFISNIPDDYLHEIELCTAINLQIFKTSLDTRLALMDASARYLHDSDAMSVYVKRFAEGCVHFSFTDFSTSKSFCNFEKVAFIRERIYDGLNVNPAFHSALAGLTSIKAANLTLFGKCLLPPPKAAAKNLAWLKSAAPVLILGAIIVIPVAISCYVCRGVRKRQNVMQQERDKMVKEEQEKMNELIREYKRECGLDDSQSAPDGNESSRPPKQFNEEPKAFFHKFGVNRIPGKIKTKLGAAVSKLDQELVPIGLAATRNSTRARDILTPCTTSHQSAGVKKPMEMGRNSSLRLARANLSAGSLAKWSSRWALPAPTALQVRKSVSFSDLSYDRPTPALTKTYGLYRSTTDVRSENESKAGGNDAELSRASGTLLYGTNTTGTSSILNADNNCSSFNASTLPKALSAFVQKITPVYSSQPFILPEKSRNDEKTSSPDTSVPSSSNRAATYEEEQSIVDPASYKAPNRCRKSTSASSLQAAQFGGTYSNDCLGASLSLDESSSDEGTPVPPRTKLSQGLRSQPHSIPQKGCNNLRSNFHDVLPLSRTSSTQRATSCEAYDSSDEDSIFQGFGSPPPTLHSRYTTEAKSIARPTNGQGNENDALYFLSTDNSLWYRSRQIASENDKSDVQGQSDKGFSKPLVCKDKNMGSLCDPGKPSFISLSSYCSTPASCTRGESERTRSTYEARFQLGDCFNRSLKSMNHRTCSFWPEQVMPSCDNAGSRPAAASPFHSSEIRSSDISHENQSKPARLPVPSSRLEQHVKLPAGFQNPRSSNIADGLTLRRDVTRCENGRASTTRCSQKRKEFQAGSQGGSLDERHLVRTKMKDSAELNFMSPYESNMSLKAPSADYRRNEFRKIKSSSQSKTVSFDPNYLDFDFVTEQPNTGKPRQQDCRYESRSNSSSDSQTKCAYSFDSNTSSEASSHVELYPEWEVCKDSRNQRGCHKQKKGGLDYAFSVLSMLASRRNTDTNKPSTRSPCKSDLDNKTSRQDIKCQPTSVSVNNSGYCDIDSNTSKNNNTRIRHTSHSQPWVTTLTEGFPSCKPVHSRSLKLLNEYIV